jgi:hypothetical protein
MEYPKAPSAMELMKRIRNGIKAPAGSKGDILMDEVQEIAEWERLNGRYVNIPVHTFSYAA